MPSTSSPLVYGVDFGMTTSSLAALVGDGTFRLVADPTLRAGAQYSVPTAVCFDNSLGRLLVGGEAVNAKLRREDAYADNFKRDVQVGPRPFTLGGQTFEVVGLVAAVLRFLRDGAREIDPRDPVATVFTVPVEWAEGRRRLITDAAVAAGFSADSLFIIEEPVAAIEYARSVGMAADTDTVLVYDLGGSTFDCAVSTAARNGQRSIRLKGFRSFGGRDFDYKILQELQRRFPGEVNAVMPENGTGGDPGRRLRLLETCESLKVRLSDSDQVSEPLTELGPDINVLITRDEFESLIRSQIADTILCCQKMLGEIGLSWDDVDAVIPVGGSSRIPLIERELEAKAPGRVRATVERDTAVARGAALLARQQAYRILAASRPRAQELTPPAIWLAKGALPEPSIVGARPYKKFGRLWVPATWAGLIPSSAGALYLAWWHWHWLGTAAITLSCAVGVVGALLFTAEREKTSASAAVTAGGIGSAAVIALVIAGIYDYRLLVEHHTRYGLVAALASAVGIVGATTMAMLFSAGDTADAVRDAKKVADSDRELAKRISGQRWFGDADAPPDFMQPLFALPAIRGFEFSKRRDTTTFNYALAVGSRVLLISMLASADERPELGVAAASWQSRLGFSGALVKTVLVVNGYELPVLRSDEQFSMTSVMTTSVAFVDTVGHWLDEDNRILLRVVDPLFGGL